MTQHIDDFLLACTTVTADGSLASVDEVEGLYGYWCSLTSSDALETGVVLEALHARGVEPAQRDGVDYVEGLVLTGPVMTDFILAVDFAGAWGHPDTRDSAVLREVATAS
jgi:hypothetical protein